MSRPVVVLASALALFSAAGAAPQEGDLDRWLAERAESLRASGADVDAAAALRRDLARARDRLEDRGVPEAAALALTTPPALARGGLDPAEASRVLERTRRRVARFEAARRSDTARDGTGEARRTLETILADPLFEANLDPEPSAAERWLRSARRLLYETILGAIEAIASVPGLGEALAYGAIGAAIVAVALLVLRGTRRSRPAQRPTETPESIAPPEPRTADRLLARARRARSGTDAIRLAQSAAIVALQRRGSLPDRPGLTDIEGLAELRSSDPASRTPFERLCRVHDGVVYGGAAANRATVDAAISCASDIVERPT